MLRIAQLSIRHSTVVNKQFAFNKATASTLLRSFSSSSNTDPSPRVSTPVDPTAIPEGIPVVTTGTRKANKSWLSTQWKIYSELSKLRLSSLVVVTSGAGFICSGLPLDFKTMACACIGTGLCAASAGTFNQIMEKEIDANMKRTVTRIR